MQQDLFTMQLLAGQLLAGQLSTSTTEVTGLTVGGWVMMLGSIALVTSLCVFCLVRIFSESKPSDHHHVPLDIDTTEPPI